MKMKLVIPTWRGKFEYLVNKFKQIYYRVCLDILIIFILKYVEFLFLLYNTEDNILKVFPTLSYVYFTKLFHTFHELQISQVLFYDAMISSQGIQIS